MSKQHVLDIIQTAQGRAAAIDATAPGFAFNKTLSMEGYHASIDAARDEVFQYIALQSRLNAQRGRMLAAGRALAEWSSRMLCAVHSTFGKDSHPYQAAAAVKSSAPRRRPRKRRGAVVAAGRRADGPLPGPSIARGPVENVHPVAQAGLLSKDLVHVGAEGDAGTQPRRDLAVERDAVRQIEVLGPPEPREGAAGLGGVHAGTEERGEGADAWVGADRKGRGPTDEAEHGVEIDGADKMAEGGAEEDMEGPKPRPLAIDGADAGRALADAFAVPRPFHGDAFGDGTDEEADRNPGRPDVVGGAEDPGGHEGEAGGGAHGDGDAHPIDAGAPWRGCGWEGVRWLATRKRGAGWPGPSRRRS